MKKLLLIVLFFCLILSFHNCGNSSKNKESEKTIKIGAILPLTGSLSIMGDVEKNAMELALDQINKDKQKISIIFEDSKSNANGAISAVNKLLNFDKVDLVISSTTGASLAIKPKVIEAKKNLIAFCMDPDIASSSEWVVRHYIGINEEMDGILSYFNKIDLKKIKIGILYGRVPVWDKVINQKLLPFLKSNKNDVYFIESYDIKEKEFTDLIVKMKNADITHLILLGYGFEYPNIFKPLIEQKMLDNLQIIGGWGFLYTSLEKQYLEGILVSGPDYVFSNQNYAKGFHEMYKERYNEIPNFDAAFAYESIISISKNITLDETKTPLSKIFSSKSNLQGVVGNYSFSADGSMIVTTGLGQFQDGNIIKYSVKDEK